MKKCLAVLLCMMLVLSASAEGNIFDMLKKFSQAAQPTFEGNALDAAFEHGPSITESEYEFQDASAYTLNIPEALKAELGNVVLTNELIKGISVKEISPDGSTVILTDTQNLYILRGNTVTPVWYNPQRGAQDTYGNVKKNVTRLASLIGEEGLSWSHDGRYAMICSYRRVLINMQFFDPMVIDMETGEIFPLETFSTKIKEGNMSAILSAVFDANDEYLYYITYGTRGAGLFSLMRADTSNWQVKMCANTSNELCYPRLCILKDGTLMATEVPRRAADSSKLVMFTNKLGKVFFQQIRPFAIERDLFAPIWTEYSAESGWGLMLGRAGNYTVTARIRPDDKTANINEFWAVEIDGDTYKAVRVNDVSAYMEEAASSMKYASVAAVRLSPDGKYAFVAVAEKGKGVLLMIRMDDMKTQKVENAEFPLNLLNNASITWCAEDTLLLNGRLYQIQ